MNDYEIKKLYEDMEMYLIQSMKRNLGRHLNEENKVGFKFTQWQAEKLKELKRYQRENKQIIGRYTLGLDKDVSEHLQNELKQGSINAIKQYNKALGKDLKPSKVMNKSFFQTNDKKVKALIEVVNNDLKTANTSALRMVNDQYRQIIHKSAFFVGNGVFTEKQAVDEATKNFLAVGINCIEYKDGRRVNIASYSQMAIRTASLRSQLMGEGNFRKSIGRTLVKVTTHGGACPLCTKWQGKVLIDDVYSGGSSKDGNYTLLSAAMKQGFLHPNCRHGITTYYPELEEDYEEEKKTSKESITAEQIKISAEQEATQQMLNYAIRTAKKYRRLEKGSLDPNNVERYSLKRKQWTNEARRIDNQLVGNEQVRFVPANSITGVKQYMGKFADEIKINGINNLDNLNELNKTLSELKAKYPIRKLKTISTNIKKKSTMASANFQQLRLKKDYYNLAKFKDNDWLETIEENLKTINGGIDILKNNWEELKKYHNVEKTLRELEKAKIEWTENKKFFRHNVIYKGMEIRSVTTHEYGHIIADQYIGQINKSLAQPNFSYNINNKEYELVIKIKSAYNTSLRNGDIYKISKYASKNESEFFAETFAMYDIGKEALPDYVVKVIEEVIEYGKKTM